MACRSLHDNRKPQRKINVTANDFNFYGIRKWLRYSINFHNSSLNVVVSLDKNSGTLKYEITTDWHEIGKHGASVPQLNFYNPIATETSTYRYDIPFATIDREEKAFDMPGNSYAAAIPSCDCAKPVMLVTDTKYGFRTIDNSMSVDLIRSSCDPDPYPEYGIHTINVGIAIPENLCNITLKKVRDEFVHVIPSISVTKHAGTLGLNGNLFNLSGDVILSAIKTAEDSADGKTLVIRLYDANGNGGKAKLDFELEVESACVMDINENKVNDLTVSGRSVTVDVPKYEVVTIGVKMK